jgi:hypothetical protein
MAQQQPNTGPRTSYDWLPVRAKCPDGRLRMVDVRHRWDGRQYVPAEDVCGRLPARAGKYRGAEHVPGFYAAGTFYLREEE